jgi:hypothetical protein
MGSERYQELLKRRPVYDIFEQTNLAPVQERTGLKDTICTVWGGGRQPSGLDSFNLELAWTLKE